MAHNILLQFPRAVIKRSNEVTQRFKYLLILDFEATCEEKKIIQPQEIIEFPCIALSTSDWTVKEIFHEYVKPRVNPTLTSFCTKLTGIIQEDIDNQDYFPEVYSKFHAWLNKGEYLKDANKSAFVTCGDWDLKIMLPQQCKLEKLDVPDYLTKWIDLKKSYCDATTYFPRSLKDMLLKSKIPLEGRLHSGISDTKNMANIITYLANNYNIVYKINSPPKPLNVV